jgi:UDP-glucose 4-epimerase
MSVLIVGGAGYIGSHAARWLEAAGREVWVYDNLSCGHREAVSPGRLIEGELTDRAHLAQVLAEKNIDSVMHFAAFALVGESVAEPAKYYQNNVWGSLCLLNAMRDAGVSKIVFSSTTATYGEPEIIPITERAPQLPINPYGFTKLAIERALADYAHAYNFSYAALRYFNASGATPDATLGEDHDPESHLIPIILQVALGQRNEIVIFGDDYDTPDGTCIRDYIHVDDLADAHLRALERLTPGQGIEVNLGMGMGYSVREVIDACARISGDEIRVRMGERRAGDPPKLIADSSKAKKVLEWRPKYDSIDAIVETAWRWHKSHPQGYLSGGVKS